VKKRPTKTPRDSGMMVVAKFPRSEQIKIIASAYTPRCARSPTQPSATDDGTADDRFRHH
jgi:hypothetical protein